MLKEYVHDRKCILHDDGHITLPGGCFIPGTVTGKAFRECVNKWHHQNLASTSTTNALLLDMSPSPTVGILQLSSEERILSLEKKLFVLRARELAPEVQTQAQRAHNPNPALDALTAAKRPVPTPAHMPAAPVPPPVPAAQCPPPLPTTPEEANNNEELLIHPFTRAKDAVYALLTTNNFGVKPKPSPLKKPDVPLKTTTPIYDPQVASMVYAQTMDSQITITQQELISLSLGVRNQVCKATSN